MGKEERWSRRSTAAGGKGEPEETDKGEGEKRTARRAIHRVVIEREIPEKKGNEGVLFLLLFIVLVFAPSRVSTQKVRIEQSDDNGVKSFAQFPSRFEHP
jgi:hypothetical protein